MSNSFKNYFNYSASEKNGLIFILALIIIVVGIIFTLDFFVDDSQDFEVGDIDSIFQTNDTIVDPSINEIQLFEFNPNEIDQNGWERLGFSQKQAKSILNYRSKIGTFKKVEDLKKLYAIDSLKYLELLPFVLMEEEVHKNEGPIRVNINSASTQQWTKLSGIGRKRAEKIIKFRESLGGFCSINQVKETFGLPPEVFESIKESLYLDANSWQVIDVNQAKEDQLAAHPYISKKVANKIVVFRENVGLFQSVNDLDNMGLISANLYVKLQPYLTLNE